MGTDIYLSYEGQDQEEQDEQASVLFESNKGELGYIRASIWMKEENDFLRRLFPEDIWESPEPKSYDFDENYEKFKFLSEHYLLGTPMEVPHDETAEVFAEVITKLAEKVGGTVVKGGEMDEEGKKKWLRSVKAFFDKGHQLQKQKCTPRILISW